MWKLKTPRAVENHLKCNKYFHKLSKKLLFVISWVIFTLNFWGFVGGFESEFVRRYLGSIQKLLSIWSTKGNKGCCAIYGLILEKPYKINYKEELGVKSRKFCVSTIFLRYFKAFCEFQQGDIPFVNPFKFPISLAILKSVQKPQNLLGLKT